MSEAENSLPDSHAEAGSLQPTPVETSGLETGQDGGPCGESELGNGADLGGHTLLSRPHGPQGRRSLFRR